MNSKDFVRDIVTHLTGEAPDVEAVEDEYGAVISVNAKGRVSSLIGKQGITIESIRVLCKAIGYNGKHRIKVRLHEESQHSPRN